MSSGSVLSLVLFAAFTRIGHHVLANPVASTSRTLVENVVEMGKGLSEIPKGRIHMKTLNLAYNHISILTDNVFHNKSYKELTKIEIYQNKINCVQSSAFRGLRHLEEIDLADNNLTSIDPYTFKSNPKLEKVDLSRNEISFNRLNVFLISSSIENLIISHNRIEQIYETTFMGLANLENLMLDNNVLFMIASNSFKPLKKLQYLSLANTGVYRLSESMFSNNLPRIVDLQETPLAKRFDPPLKKITNNAVTNLIRIDQYIFTSDTPVQ